MEESGVAYRPDISDDVHSVASGNIFLTDVLGVRGAGHGLYWVSCPETSVCIYEVCIL